MIWRNIKELTLVKSLSAAQGVTRHSHSMVIWKNIKELMLVENHSAAEPVTRIVHSLMIWRNIKELTPVKSHSAAQGVTRNSHSMVVWKNISSPHSNNHHRPLLPSMDGHHQNASQIWTTTLWVFWASFEKFWVTNHSFPTRLYFTCRIHFWRSPNH